MATPTLVSLISGPNDNNVSGSASPWTQQPPEPSTAGNLLLAFVFVSAAGTMAANAVTDDQSQTWTRVINGTGGQNARGFVFKMENTAANVRKVTLAIGGVTSFINIILVEVFNVPSSAALGLTWSKEEGFTAGTTWDSGATQTPTAGSSIYQVAVATVNQWQSAGVSTADTAKGYRMEADDLIQGNCIAQSWEGIAATTHSPTLTVATAATWLSLAVEVRAGSGGADGPAFRCKRAVGMNYNSIADNADHSCQYHMPIDGNLILVDSSNGVTSTAVINSIAGATYTQHGASPLIGPGSGGTLQHFHADNVTPSRTAVAGKIIFNAAPNGIGGVVWFREILGAAASPLDTGATGSAGLTGASGALFASANQGAPGNLNVGTITPSVGTAYVTCYIDHSSGSEIGMNDATVNFFQPYANQDGGCSVFYTLDSGMAGKVVTGAQNFTYQRSATAASDYEGLAAAYKAAAVGTTPSATDSEPVTLAETSKPVLVGIASREL